MIPYPHLTPTRCHSEPVSLRGEWYTVVRRIHTSFHSAASLLRKHCATQLHSVAMAGIEKNNRVLLIHHSVVPLPHGGRLTVREAVPKDGKTQYVKATDTLALPIGKANGKRSGIKRRKDTIR